MVIGGGAALSALSAVAVMRANESALERDFHELAGVRGKAIERRLADSVEVLHSVAKLFDASASVERSEFRMFVEGWLEDRPGLEAFEWIPREADEQPDPAAETAADGDLPMGRPRTLDNAERAPQETTAAFRVAFAEPRRHASAVVGLDLSALPGSEAAMNRASDTGRAVAFKAVPRVAEHEPVATEPNYVRVLWPVYHQDQRPSDSAAGPQSVRGFLAAVINLDAASKEALKEVTRTHDALDTFVLDLERPANRQMIHAWFSPQRAPGDRRGFEEDDIRAGLHNRVFINLAGRPLEVLCAPTRAFYAMRASWLAWGILAAGLGCSGLLAACISLVDRRTRAVDQVNRDLRREIAERRRIQSQLVSAKEGTDSANRQLKQEIAERIRAEQDRRESESRLHELADNIRDVLWVSDADDGRILYVSPAYEAVWGRSCQSLYASPRDRVAALHPEDCRRVARAWSRPLDRPRRQEYRIVRPDGSVRWIEDRFTSIRDGAGALRRVVGIAEDITERKEAEEELRRTHEALQASQKQLLQAAKLESIGRLAAGVAHEVKNPLATLLLGLDYLAEGGACADEQSQHIVESMRESIRRADTVIRGLLDFAAPREIKLQPEDINDVIERSLMLVKGDLLHSHVDVERRLANGLPGVRIDSQKMQQVFVNLFVNSCQAMPEGGTITVSTLVDRSESDDGGAGGLGADDRGARVIVRVDDTGTGIPEDKLEKVFDPFFTTKPVGVGTGLGLSVSKKILELHEATIHFRNRSEGGVRATLSFGAIRAGENQWTRSESSSSMTK